MTELNNSPRLIAAIDLETVPDPLAEGLVAFARPTRRAHSALHRIDAFAWVAMVEKADGEWKVDRLTSEGDGTDEFDLLLSLDELVRDLRERNGQLCSWNGSRHDLPMIFRRATRHWMFDLDGLFPPSPIHHLDLMSAGAGLRESDWPKLREACAGVGISCNPTPDGLALIGNPRVRKAEVDAIATLLLRLHQLAGQRQDRRILVKAWSALVDFIRQNRPLDAHLSQFTRSVELEAALAYDKRHGN